MTKKKKVEQKVWKGTTEDVVVEVKQVLPQFDKTYFNTEWIKKELGTIEGEYILIGITQAGHLIIEHWKLQ